MRSCSCAGASELYFRAASTKTKGQGISNMKQWVRRWDDILRNSEYRQSMDHATDGGTGGRMKCDHQFVQHCSKCETFIVPESCRLTDAERAVIEAAFKHLIGSSKHPCCELDSATDALRAERAPRFIRPTGTKDDEVWAAAMGVLSEPHSDAPAWRRLVAALEAASERIK